MKNVDKNSGENRKDRGGGGKKKEGHEDTLSLISSYWKFKFTVRLRIKRIFQILVGTKSLDKEN